MGLIHFIGLCIVVGLLVYGAYRLPIKDGFKVIIYGVALFAVIVVLADAMGLLNWDIQIPRLR